MELIGQSGNIVCSGLENEFSIAVSNQSFFTKCFKTVGDVEVFPTVQSDYSESSTDFKVILEPGLIEVGEEFYIKCYKF